MDNNNYYVNQDNILVQAAYNLSLDEMRIILIALSKVDSKKPQPEDFYTITADEFAELTGDKNNAYVKMNNAAKAINRNPIQEFSKTERNNVLIDEVHWFSRLTYVTKEGWIKFKFSGEVAPFIYDLKANFTQMRLKHALDINSPFAVRIYCLLLMAENIQANKNKRTKVLEIKKDWLLEKTGLIDKYQDFRTFKRDLIDKAVTRINKNTDYTVTAETIKNGRVAVGIKFSYIVEKDKHLSIKLPKRPQAIKGSDLEGKWAQSCIKILLDYQERLAAKERLLPKDDAKKLIKYAEIVGDKYLIEDTKRLYNLD